MGDNQLTFSLEAALPSLGRTRSLSRRVNCAAKEDRGPIQSKKKGLDFAPAHGSSPFKRFWAQTCRVSAVHTMPQKIPKQMRAWGGRGDVSLVLPFRRKKWRGAEEERVWVECGHALTSPSIPALSRGLVCVGLGEWSWLSAVGAHRCPRKVGKHLAHSFLQGQAFGLLNTTLGGDEPGDCPDTPRTQGSTHTFWGGERRGRAHRAPQGPSRRQPPLSTSWRVAKHHTQQASRKKNETAQNTSPTRHTPHRPSATRPPPHTPTTHSTNALVRRAWSWPPGERNAPEGRPWQYTHKTPAQGCPHQSFLAMPTPKAKATHAPTHPPSTVHSRVVATLPSPAFFFFHLWPRNKKWRAS